MKNKGILIGIIAVIIIIAIVSVVMITGKKETTATQQETEVSKQETQDVYSFKAQEKTVQLGVDFATLDMPKEEQYSEIESCAFEGLDKEYTYEHYVISTYPDGQVDKVKSVYFLDDQAQTTEGIKIGDTVEKMIETYGEKYTKSDNQYTYEKGKTQIIFLVEEDKITQIEYNYITD